jgi:hypothetical protein
MEADFDPRDFEDRTKSDSKALCRFFLMPMEIGIVDGLKKFRDVEMCEIIVPGNQTNRPVKKVNDIIKRRYAAQYAQWKASGMSENVVEGTHLTTVSWMTRSQVEELAYVHIRTLEQLAEVGDDVCTRMPGLYDLKRKAKDFVAAGKKNAPILNLQKQLDEEKAKNLVLQQNIEAMSRRLAALEDDEEPAPKRRKKG